LLGVQPRRRPYPRDASAARSAGQPPVDPSPGTAHPHPGAASGPPPALAPAPTPPSPLLASPAVAPTPASAIGPVPPSDDVLPPPLPPSLPPIGEPASPRMSETGVVQDAVRRAAPASELPIQFVGPATVGSKPKIGRAHV